MIKGNGKFLEQLVQVLEQLISLDSIVEHNVQLPIIASKIGATAQCDIIIRKGKKPRESITIVEVQDRNRPVEINDFRGWKQKLEDVGAQHLYCVSRSEFPQSIKEQASFSGNTIKLITLKEVDPDLLKVILFDFIFKYQDVDVWDIKKDESYISAKEANELGIPLDKVEHDLIILKSNDLKFSFDKQNLKALSGLCIEKMEPDQNIEEATSSLEFGFDDNKPFYFFCNDVFLRMQLRISYKWKNKTITIKPAVFSYDQNEDGALAWVVEAFYVSSRGPIWLKFPVIKDGNSFLLYGMILTVPINVDLKFNIEQKGKSDSD